MRIPHGLTYIHCLCWSQSSLQLSWQPCPILKTFGVPKKITLFSKLYTQTECCVWVNAKESRWFSVKTGVKQGSVAPPDLFNCVADHIMTWDCQRITEVRLGNYQLTDLEYANDTTLFRDRVADLKAGLNIFQKETSKLGLQESWEKTKLMHVGNSADLLSTANESTTIDFMDSFNYLRSLILSTGDLSGEISQCCSHLAVIMEATLNTNSISFQRKLHIYNISVFLVLIYSSETWPLRQSFAKK